MLATLRFRASVLKSHRDSRNIGFALAISCSPGEGKSADTLIAWKEEEKLSRIVDHAELARNDYNISPSRYIHTSDAETYRPLAEIVADLNAVEAEAREADAALREILRKIGV